MNIITYTGPIVQPFFMGVILVIVSIIQLGLYAFFKSERNKNGAEYTLGITILIYILITLAFTYLPYYLSPEEIRRVPAVFFVFPIVYFLIFAVPLSFLIHGIYIASSKMNKSK